MKPLRDCRDTLVDELLARPAQPDYRDDPLRPVLASMLAGRALGEGIMSATLGLPAADFEALCAGFSARYATHYLVWFEQHETRESAFQRERQIKKWNRAWKISRIEQENPLWRDLFDELVQ